MGDVVIDASAILAYLGDEPGSDAVEDRLGSGLLSAVNLTEVVGKLVERGAAPEMAVEIVVGLGCEIVAVDFDLGVRAGTMILETRGQGLSLGDRSCLALAEREGLPALTADRAWDRLSLPIVITLIR
jgi:ribonuclease VapC